MIDQQCINACFLIGALAVSGCAGKSGPASESSPGVEHDVQASVQSGGVQPAPSDAELAAASSRDRTRREEAESKDGAEDAPTKAGRDRKRKEPELADGVGVAPAPASHPPDPAPSSSKPVVSKAGMGIGGEPAGVHHPLERGMTLYKLSKAYGVPVETLIAANQITDPASIPAGTKIFVPGATVLLPLSPGGAPAGPRFAWPLSGRVTSPYGPSRRRAHHAGIDIDGESGEEIRAAADGRVARIADNARYGLMVVVEHDGGYATWYAHASGLLVGKGDVVTRGQPIALVGVTGNAHGSHLHFEVRRNGAPVDPFPFLESRGTAPIHTSAQ